MKIFLTFLLLSFNAWSANFKAIHIADLEKMQTGKKHVFIYDANVESTRTHVGKIPEAVLLESSSKYETQTTLPSNKDSLLVFYCANEQCTASHTAAERASAAGYKNVSVMIDGIYGWQKAGKALEPVIESGSKVEPKVAFEMQKKSHAVIVDVREQEERHEIVPDSLWFPMSEINNKNKWQEFVGRLPKNQLIVFHCAAGMRSKKVAGILKQEGYRTSYFEGPDQWKSEGLPLQQQAK
jgi:rhodanese-related sulfurtransferase